MNGSERKGSRTPTGLRSGDAQLLISPQRCWQSDPVSDVMKG